MSRLGEAMAMSERDRQVQCEKCDYIGPLPEDMRCPGCGTNGSLYEDKVTRWYYKKGEPLINLADYVDD